MDIVISGRRMTVTEELRQAVIERLEREVNKLSDQVQRVEVEFSAGEGKNTAVTTAEITLRAKGRPVVRAAGAAEDKRVAFESALDKLRTQLRRAADRRKSRRGLRAQDLASLPVASPPEVTLPVPVAESTPSTRIVAGVEVSGDGPMVVREKTFSSPALTLAQALDEMELVGHDFFLYVDATSGLPSVVYRRKAYDYGVLHLEVTD
ncbi:MAG: ribosome-associated translation inhibitor RaiA [Propionibacteriaceae bacterium]|nr:ribosome-associated translation inhibitor RaiA [Propionibacteriaceae bacterium]